MDLVPCENCGSTDFTKKCGFYICTNCDTQSQNIQEQSFDFENSRFYPNNEDVVEEASHKTGRERNLTSWECYNILLRELVEELVELGASPKLKVIAFQIWADYLKRANVAFTSKTENKLPYLTLGFKNNDAEALYGVSKLRKKLFGEVMSRKKKLPRSKTEKSCSSSDISVKTNCSHRSLRQQQRKMSLSKLKENTAESVTSHNDTILSVEREMLRKSRKRKYVAFRPAARAALDEVLELTKKARKKSKEKDISKKDKKTISNKIYDYKSNINKGGGNVPTNTINLISILRIALLIIGDDIQLGDILRWICEGRLSVNQPEKFVPKFDCYAKKNDLISCNRNTFQTDIKNVTTFLNLSNVPTPNLYKLARQYCTDLCLPDEFVQIVLKIMVLSKPRMDYSLYKFRIFPDYECRVMAFILYTFKLLFSVDDCTELSQSKFAEAMNECREQENAQEISKLFVWTHWVRYMVCRKAVLSEYDVSVNQLSSYDRLNNQQVFLNYWDKLKPTYQTTYNVINSAFLSSLQSDVRKLIDETKKPDETPNINFPASDTPFLTSINYLIAYHPTLLPRQTREILSEEFTLYSVKYILDENWCNQLAVRLKLNAEITFDSDEVEIQKYVKPEENIPTLSKTTVPPQSTPTLVTIEENMKKPSRSRTKPKPELTIYDEEINLNDNFEKSADVCFKIFNPSRRYWFFHEFHRSISTEKFNEMVTDNLPKSFIWLLKECATMLRVDVKELYLELIQVEAVLCRDYVDQDYDKKIPLKLFPNEW